MLTGHDQESELEIRAESSATQQHGMGPRLMCNSNCEDTAFGTETLLDQETSVPGIAEEVYLDVIKGTDAGDFKLMKDEDRDATEFSSSFGETVSHTEDGSRLSEAEVESRFRGDDGMDSNVFDGFDRLFRMRKKKLTCHWRRYINPVMWRCKWIELRMKELRSQALKYDKELVATSQRKHLELGKYSSEYGVKSLPRSGVRHRKVMKRRKRKRIEETIDILSYMSHHNLFSYYENKRSDPDGASVDDDCGIRVIEANDNNHGELDLNDGCLSVQFRADDALEQVLWNIEMMQSRVQKLRIHMDKLLTENAAKFSSLENLSVLLQIDGPSSYGRSLTLSPHNRDMRPLGSLYLPTRNMPEYDIRDMVTMQGAISVYEEASPDIIESTSGLLYAAEVSHDQRQNGDSCENIADDILIHNQAAEKELIHFVKIGTLLIEKPQESAKEEQDKVVVPTSASEHGPTRENLEAHKQSVLKSCLTSDFHVPKNKRKRGERKAGAGTWSADKISIK